MADSSLKRQKRAHHRLLRNRTSRDLGSFVGSHSSSSKRPSLLPVVDPVDVAIAEVDQKEDRSAIEVAREEEEARLDSLSGSVLGKRATKEDISEGSRERERWRYSPRNRRERSKGRFRVRSLRERKESQNRDLSTNERAATHAHSSDSSRKRPK